ncbi:MAG: ABC transporter ATP-binding protein [Caldicoprobacterales bacterium]|nr:ABC transporter ATP-binding protein [Bacillota bacterium]
MNSKKFVLDFVKRHKAKYIFGIIFVLVVDVLQMVLPRIIGQITDDMQNRTINKAMLLSYAGLILLVALLTMTFRYLYRIYIIGTEKKLEYELRKKLFDHMLTLSSKYYNTHKTGDLMAHATNDINAVRMAAGMGVLLLVDTVFLTISVIIIMLATIDIRLTLIALSPLPLIAIFSMVFGKFIHKRFTQVQEAFSGLTERVQESLSGIRVVKAFVQERPVLEQFNAASQKSLEKNMRLARLWGIMFPLGQMVATLSYIIAFSYGGIQVINGHISLGEFIAFNTYLGLLIWPMMSFGWIMNIVQRGSASLDRINVILTAIPDIKDNDPLPIGSIEGHIEFENVSFSYNKKQEPVLKDININLEPGRTLAIIGETGSGKTSLVNLILRLYDISGGKLKIDGSPIDRIPLSTLRTSIGYVPQDSFLFSTSIRENIAFGVEKASIKEIEEAAKTAQIYDNIMDLPDGFDTIVGERGVTLSGGQKQRVSIARALIKDPKILVLDDSLSAVDTDTEERILQGLKVIMKDRTSIIIAHRISSIKHADEIIVLDNGQIVERGRHDRLIDLKGHYYSLYQKQLLEEELDRA